MASINPNYLAMGGYGMGQQYQPLPPLALTQPAAIPDWRSPYVPPAAQGFNVGQPAQPNLQIGPQSAAAPTYGVGSAYGPDNIDVGGGWNPALAGGSATAPKAPGSIFDSFLQQRGGDGTTSGGWGQAGLGILQGVGGLYLGMQQYNLAKDALATSKEQFNRQFEVNKNLTNSRLEDRQRARVASNAGAYQSVGDYMNQNGVK